jgi:hypothetical protein
MGSRHPNPRLAKIHRSYSVEAVSRLFKIHNNTASKSLRQGLEPIDDQRPTLIRGQELARSACGSGRNYCLRAPKVSAGKMAEYIEAGDTTVTLQGICSDCNRMIYRRINGLKLAAVRGNLEVTVIQARPRLRQRAGALRKSCKSVPLTGQRGQWLRVSFANRLPAVRWDDNLYQIHAASAGLS